MALLQRQQGGGRGEEFQLARFYSSEFIWPTTDRPDHRLPANALLADDDGGRQAQN